MPPVVIDTHAHLDDERFAADLPAVLRRAEEAGLSHILSVGTDLVTSRRAVELARTYPMIRAIVGIHPNHTAEAGPNDWAELLTLAVLPEVVALGESGLDQYHQFAALELQRDYFERHLKAARELNLPIVIHSRAAEPLVAEMLEAVASAHGPIAGVIHSFTGDAATAARCLAVGMHVSFAGMATYKNAGDIRTVAATIPSDRLLIETDCPYLAPVPHRGKRNEPAYVIHTAHALAEARGEGLANLLETTTKNARRLFKLE